MLDGEWEPSLIASIRNLINEGDESTLFVDIGANIGLTSAPMCNDVTKLIAIEPNPVSALILQANLMLSSRSNNYSIVEKAICADAGTQTLVTPEGNLGGAFINSTTTSLTTTELERKEGGAFSVESSHVVSAIDAETFFSDLINDPDHRGIQKVILKIDVEGQEGVIIRALLSSPLWREKRVALFFESWRSTEPIEFMRIANTNLFARETNGDRWFICNQKSFHNDLTEFFLSNFNVTPSVKCSLD